MNSQNKHPFLKRLILPFCMLLVLFIGMPGYGQIKPLIQVKPLSQIKPEDPPKPFRVEVSVSQHLNFGKIIPNSDAGGTVSVDINGFRTSTGDIILLSDLSTSPALFIVYALPGTLVTIDNIPDSQISKNTKDMKLKLGEPSTGKTFITTGETTNVFVGGTLTVGSLTSNPSGEYSGTFTVTFNQQ